MWMSLTQKKNEQEITERGVPWLYPQPAMKQKENRSS